MSINTLTSQFRSMQVMWLFKYVFHNRVVVWMPRTVFFNFHCSGSIVHDCTHTHAPEKLERGIIWRSWGNTLTTNKEGFRRGRVGNMRRETERAAVYPCPLPFAITHQPVCLEEPALPHFCLHARMTRGTQKGRARHLAFRAFMTSSFPTKIFNRPRSYSCIFPVCFSCPCPKTALCEK